MAAPLLQTRNLSMRFGGVQAVRTVDFTLAEGELRCLIGPNGAGKSTFFKMLTGQLQPSGGQVLFRGRDISQAHAHQIARLGIGIKTQVPSVFDGLSVRENIWLAASRIASGGRVVLSGILPSQANAVIAAYQPLALQRRLDIDGWTTLVLVRRRL